MQKRRNKQKQKQKLKISIRLIIAGAGILCLVAGIFIYLNLSQTQESKAQKHTTERFKKPVDWEQPQLLIKQTETRVNGVCVKKAIDLSQSAQ
jgi:flagellar basal body-associated protein FliL